MSSEDAASSDTEAVSREVAWRVFAREYNDADLAFKEGDDERAPNYVATPTGAKINRLFVVGVLTEIERVGDGDLLRARVSDPTGTFVVYAGQYQPDAVSFLADAETPSFVSVVGKARTYEPEDGDDIYTSIRPEGINVVDSRTRDRWNVETARETLRRVEAVRGYVRDGMTPEMRPPLHELGEVVDHYGTDESYLNELEREARDVLTEVAGVEAGAGTGAGGATDADSPPASNGTSTSTGDDAADNEDTQPMAETNDGNVEASETSTTTETTDGEPSTGAETGETTEDADEVDETGETESSPVDDLDDVEQEDVGEWDWDEGEREEVEEEFGAEFESGADIAEEGTDDGDDETTEAEDGTDETTESADGTEATDDADESAETVVMNIIEEENGDKGAERPEIVEKAAERGIDEEVAEAALEDLLLEGMCYPTDGDRIKPL